MKPQIRNATSLAFVTLSDQQVFRGSSFALVRVPNVLCHVHDARSSTVVLDRLVHPLREIPLCSHVHLICGSRWVVCLAVTPNGTIQGRAADSLHQPPA